MDLNSTERAIDRWLVYEDAWTWVSPEEVAELDEGVFQR